MYVHVGVCTCVCVCVRVRVHIHVCVCRPSQLWVFYLITSSLRQGLNLSASITQRWSHMCATEPWFCLVCGASVLTTEPFP